MNKSRKIKSILESVGTTGVQPEWPFFANRYKSEIIKYPTQMQTEFLRDLEDYTKEIMEQHPDLSAFVKGKMANDLCRCMQFEPDFFDNLKLVMRGNNPTAREILFKIAGQSFPLFNSKPGESDGIIIGSIKHYKLLMERIAEHTLELNHGASTQQVPATPPSLNTFNRTFFSPPPTLSYTSQLTQQINSLLDAMRIMGGCKVSRININPSGHRVDGRFYQYELEFCSAHQGENFSLILNMGIQDTSQFCSRREDRSKFYIKTEEQLQQCFMRMRELEQPPLYGEEFQTHF